MTVGPDDNEDGLGKNPSRSLVNRILFKHAFQIWSYIRGKGSYLIRTRKLGKFALFAGIEAPFVVLTTLMFFLPLAALRPEPKDMCFKYADISVISDGALSSARWINSVLVSSAVIALAIILGRIQGGLESVSLFSIPIAPSFSLLIFFITTIAHFYTTKIYLHTLRDLVHSSNLETSKLVYGRLVYSGGLFFRGLRSRRNRVDGKIGLQSFDPPYIVAVLAMLVCIVAALPWSVSLSLVVQIPFVMLLVFYNYVFASSWAVATSNLQWGKATEISGPIFS